MAELALLPAVRAAAPDTLIVADGTSCRHQLADALRGTTRPRALHVAEVLERALAASDRRAPPAAAAAPTRETGREALHARR
jgi:hypothetical protein